MKRLILQKRGAEGSCNQWRGSDVCPLPRSLSSWTLKLFGKTILVVNNKFILWPADSGCKVWRLDFLQMQATEGESVVPRLGQACPKTQARLATIRRMERKVCQLFFQDCFALPLPKTSPAHSNGLWAPLVVERLPRFVAQNGVSLKQTAPPFCSHCCWPFDSLSAGQM